jgi:hypothetical protein
MVRGGVVGGIGVPGPIEVQILDTVLGVSVTPTTVGWVLAEGHGADGTILDHHELKLHGGRGVRAVSTAEQVADEVLRVEALAGASDHRVRVVGVTWNDDAAAEAALLFEALTDADFDNVVPVRYLEALETLARAIAPVIGYEQTAVCILEHEWANVVMVDAHDDETRTAVKHVRGGFDGLTSWLSGMFDRDGWRPSGVLVVGSDLDINALSWQLEKTLPVPVFAQSMAQVTVARGAALAAAASTEFTDEQLLDATVGEPAPEPAARPRQFSYAGAVTALAAGAITFVTSLSLAVGLQLAPDNASGTKHPVHTSTPPVEAAVAPPAAPPPAPRDAVQPMSQAQPPAGPAAAPGALPAAPIEQQNARVLEHIPGAYGDSDSQP